MNLRISLILALSSVYAAACVDSEPWGKIVEIPGMFEGLDNLDAWSRSPDGGIVLGGSYWETNLDPAGFWMKKYDTEGNVQIDEILTRTHPAGATGCDRPMYIQQAEDSGFFFAGRTSYHGRQLPNESFVTRYNKDLEIEWDASFPDLHAKVGCHSADGGYVIVTGQPDESMVAMKLDSLGVLEREEPIGSLKIKPMFITPTSDGGYILIGWSRSEQENAAWMVKLDNAVQVEWSLEPWGRSVDSNYALELDSGGFVAWVEQLSDDHFSTESLAFVTADGELEHLKAIDIGLLNRIQKTSDGGFLLLGGAVDGWDWDARLSRLDSSGDLIWMKDFGGSSVDLFNISSAETDDGYILFGCTGVGGIGEFQDKGPRHLCWLIRTDPDGNRY